MHTSLGFIHTNLLTLDLTVSYPVNSVLFDRCIKTRTRKSILTFSYVVWDSAHGVKFLRLKV